MRFNPLVLCALLVASCVQQPVAPLEPNMVRVTLDSGTRAEMQAYRIDGKPVRQLRFPDLPAGEHELQVRYRFEIPGGAGVGQAFSDRRRTCILGVEWDFSASTEYQISAYRLGWNPIGWLETLDGERLVRAKIIRCGPGV